MKTTYSTAADRARVAAGRPKGAGRGLEFAALMLASIVSLVGFALVYQAKTAAVPAIDRDLAARRIVNAAAAQQPDDLLPGLAALPDPGVRRVVADRLFAYLTTADSAGVRLAIDSVGTFGRVRVTAREIAADRRLAFLRGRLKPAAAGTAADPNQSVPLLTSEEVAAIKPAFVVRRPADFRWNVTVSVVLFLAGFWLAHLVGRARGQAADGLLVPIVLVLSAVGLMAMISLRDPVRDALLFARFAQGVLIGCVLMAAVSMVDFQRSVLRKLSYVPLVAAFVLSTLLILFGSGPGSSDARVNLFGMQPVEAIRVLVLLFLAGYFANRWEFLRELREDRSRVHPLVSWLEIPRLEYVVPVLAGIGLVLVFFFLQKDLGPALVLSCVFLSLYGVARKRLTLVAAGLLLLAAGFATGYLVDYPHTVVQRVAMWKSPWDNPVRGGDQVSHALWGLASGGWSGTGLGLGDPHSIPAAHTDLVLAAVGEELGFVGIAALLALYGLLTWRALRIALGATGDYAFFLALGISVSLALELLLISGGLLGLVPLTGVVTPFLSYGRSSMLANFAVIGVLLSVSGRRSPARVEFKAPVYALASIVAVLGGIVFLRVAYVQGLHADDVAAAANLTVQADGMRRYEYNPRLIAAARQIVRGTIYDRNGVPLAASKAADLEAHREELEQMGVSLDDACVPGERCYPFGGLTYHLLGDWHTKVNWAASNTSFVERDSDRVLRGYDDHASIASVKDPRNGAMVHIIRRDYRELLPLLRNRYRPDSPSVKQLLERPRDLHLSIDVRLQQRVAADLQARIEKSGTAHLGAAVVLSDSGDLLAAVSYPWPTYPLDSPRLVSSSKTARSRQKGAVARADAPSTDVDSVGEAADEALFDRARYGVYPPGSSFKLVTAAAALRKDPTLEHQTFTCERLSDNRVGTRIHGWARPIRDDVQDKTPHGTLDMPRALVVSCNAYFAQLGLKVGAQPLLDAAHLFEISLGQPESLKQVRDLLPFTAYGQGQVLASPFKMARVAATVAAGGAMPYGRWVVDTSNTRPDLPRPVLSRQLADRLGAVMREVVTSGTGRVLRDVQPAIAGKTGTAEVQDEASHSWFVGFAPYDAPPGKRVAFAVIVEHGGYGAGAAAPIAGDIVADAKKVGVIK